ncbi:hypothetical protein ACIBIZ_33715 [Nonomuraea spiralis]|uniref:Uncharacterized protein n=1 Tax=Nonomuraea spiralis TaxID=46182 RepID=A0ABV5IRJ8_9ACTN|nr:MULTISPECIES: hypothetical protein [Nonomuraea]RSN03046.1 hypothetical protein DMB42_34990 [Nonomuraea sp. WAC 01424]GGT34654.1 hypothetical protein GCM10010176_093960 [Nonomuraea spiralis]
MIRKIATGILAIAATSAVALSLPTAASASTADFDDYSGSWGPVYAKYHLAKAQGQVSVEWDDDESNEVHVSGRLYDLDDRDYDEGGKCGYVKFQAEDSEGDWSTVYTKKYCGFPGYKKFHFEENDVFTLRAKVCQVSEQGSFATKCGPWSYLYTAEDE